MHRSVMSRLGPWGLVTGATSGIGAALAVQLARAGMRLVITGRSPARLTEAAESLRGAGAPEVRVVVVDLASADGPERVALATEGLDLGLVVLNAGFGTSGRFIDASLSEERELLAVNCGALLGMAWHFGRRLAARGRGSLVFVGSVLGFQGTPLAANYGASKAYVQALGEALAVELGQVGVDVLVAAPGPTHSGFAGRAGMTMGVAMDSEAVARGIYRSLGRRGTVFPGWLSKLLRGLMMGLPRWVAARIFAVALGGMVSREGVGEG